MTPISSRPAAGPSATARPAWRAMLLPLTLVLTTVIGLLALYLGAVATLWLAATKDPSLGVALAVYLAFAAAPLAGWRAYGRGQHRLAWLLAGGALLAAAALIGAAMMR